MNIQRLTAATIALSLSLGMWHGASLIARARWVWKRYRDLKPYLETGNLPRIGAGHLIEGFFSDFTAIKIFSHFLLISTRINALCTQEETFSLAYNRWKEALLDTYPLPRTKNFSKYPSLTFLVGKPTALRWISRLDNLQRRLQRIFQCHLALFAEAFLVSMRVMDVLELVFAEHEERNSLARESFRTQLFNVFNTLKSLEKHKKRICQKISFVSRLAGRSENLSSLQILPHATATSVTAIEEHFFTKIAAINRCEKTTKAAFKQLSEWICGYHSDSTDEYALNMQKYALEYPLEYASAHPGKFNAVINHAPEIEAFALEDKNLEDKKKGKNLLSLLNFKQLNVFVPTSLK